MKRFAWIVAVLLTAAALAWAAPRLVNYQGYLTTASGLPVPDGSYALQISVYADSTGGAAIWTESPTVTASGGVFQVVLGSLNPLGATVFEGEPRWLGIRIGADAEIAPRTKITSVPWALRAGIADSALAVPPLPPDGDWTIMGDNMYSAVPGNVGVGTASPVVDLHVVGSDSLGTVMIAPGLSVNEDSRLFLAEDNDGTYGMEWRFNGVSNELELWGKSSSTLYGPHMTVARNTGATAFSGTGNSAITLPASGVSSAEMFDEPGITCSLWTGGSQLIYSSPHTLMSRSIVCPGPGYVVALASVYVQFSVGGTSASDCNFAISDQNTSLSDPYYAVTLPGYDSEGTHNVPVTMHHVFSVTASGTYTYYILAQEDIGDFRVYDKELTLIFVPTAYGGVTLAAAGVSSVTSDVAVERAATEAANTARLEREIAELRAEIQKLRASVGED